MKILAVSDIHGRRSNVQKLVERIQEDPPELIVIAGDLSNGSMKEAVNVLEIFRRSSIKTVFVPGNMDPPELVSYEDDTNTVINIHLKTVEINGIVVAGVGGSNITPFNTYIEFSESEIKKMLEEVVGGIVEKSRRLIMVTHAPPYGTAVDRVFTGLHVGSRSLREFVEAEQPLALVSGHIHEARGIDKLGSTLIINPGPLFRGYYAVVYVDEDKDDVHAELYRLHG